MALKVIPGPLRGEGPGFVPAAAIPPFVNATEIENFDLTSFDQTSALALKFVHTATDPPATSVRGRNTLWFQRGDGRVYTWDTAWSTTSTDGRWVALTDRRELIVRAQNEAFHNLPYGILHFNNEETGVSNNGSSRVVPQVEMHDNLFYELYVAYQSDATLTQSEPYSMVAHELGYTKAKVHSDGSGPAYGLVVDTTGNAVDYFALTSGDSAYWPDDRVFVAHIVESGPASAVADGRMMVFMKAQSARRVLS